MTKILLVEDDRSLREIYGVRLLAEGYDIVSASDGETALATAIREKPDLIISDVMMPKMSGFEMLDLLHGNESTKDIKVIMMTALSSDQQRERGESLGADRYLVKSQVGIEDLVTATHEVLGDKEEASAAPTMLVQFQSPINPPAAVTPSSVANVEAPAMPAEPMQVQTVTNPNIVAPVPTAQPIQPDSMTVAVQVNPPSAPAPQSAPAPDPRLNVESLAGQAPAVNPIFP
ncbi:response regulator, partial [Candidatus Saccharibacteria bacterium]|nr:response regulator [Candidatus Saccharibacteria bacterium]